MPGDYVGHMPQSQPPEGQGSWGIDLALTTICPLLRAAPKGLNSLALCVEWAPALKSYRCLIARPEGAWQAPDNSCYRRLWGPAMGRWQVGSKKGARYGGMMEREGVCIINLPSTEEEIWTQRDGHLSMFPKTLCAHERAPQGLSGMG